MKHLRQRVTTYFVSIALVAVAVVLTFAIRPVFGGKAPLTFFTIAVVVSAAYGGLWAGILSTVLGVLIADWLFQQSLFLLAQSQSSLFLFAVLGVAISAIVQLLHQANAKLTEARSQVEEANKKLLQRTEALSRSNEELQRFAYAVSHDLQAPLRNVGTLTALLVRGNENLNDASKGYAQLIINGVNQMEGMIKGLLDYAAATTAITDLAASTNCNTALQNVLHTIQYFIDANHATITSDELPTVPMTEGRLCQVLSNLITNAIKYHSPDRNPAIHVSAKDNGAEWTFKIADNGIGIDMKYADQIFELFKRLNAPDECEGSGVGLAICKAVVERHNGRIWVESELGKGSTFFFTIPKITTSHNLEAADAVTAKSINKSTNLPAH